MKILRIYNSRYTNLSNVEVFQRKNYKFLLASTVFKSIFHLLDECQCRGWQRKHHPIDLRTMYTWKKGTEKLRASETGASYMVCLLWWLCVLSCWVPKETSHYPVTSFPSVAWSIHTRTSHCLLPSKWKMDV